VREQRTKHDEKKQIVTIFAVLVGPVVDGRAILLTVVVNQPPEPSICNGFETEFLYWAIV
jgi:hypothetical protein